MSEDEAITDLDLVAYADGLFVADCTRRRRLERHLADCPEDAERVADYRAQDAAIRAAYGDLVTERVPERIERLFAEPDRPSWIAPLQRAAAAVLIAAVAAAAGWYASDTFDDGITSAADQLAKLAARHTAEQPLAVAAASSEAMARPQQADEARMVIELSPPDLTAQHLRLTKFDRVRDKHGAAMRLSYIDEQGKAVSLFLRPSRHMKPPKIRMQVEAGVAVASWQTGPFAVALTAEGRKSDVAKLAAAVQAAIGRSMFPASLAPRMAGNPLPAPQSGLGGEMLDNQLPRGVLVPKVN